MYYDSVSDFIEEHLPCDDLGYEITRYLGNMPIVRASVDDILSAADVYDCPELYIALFTRFQDLLDEDEHALLKERFQRLFDLPLPDEAD